jgi:hypothetical protein
MVGEWRTHPEGIHMINATLIKKLEPEYVLDVFGIKSSYNSEGNLHSFDDYPALIYKNGAMVWYKDGRIHRDNDKPAVIRFDGDREWWVNGRCIRSARL